MPQMSPKRCPFLLGELWENSFSAKAKGQDIKVNFKCSQNGGLFNTQFGQLPKERGCLNGDYLSCQWYAERILKQSSEIPNLCPQCNEEKDECTMDNSNCERYWIDANTDGQDYRDCLKFSKWFWEQLTKNRDGHNEFGDANE